MVTARLPRDELAEELHALHGVAGTVAAIGDALAPSTIAAAVFDGRRYAEELDAPPRDSGETPFLREVTGLSPARPPAA
jgi:dimethylamine/trimethylamine dehydrogenase